MFDVADDVNDDSLSDLYKNMLNAAVPAPRRQHWQLGGVDLAVDLVDERQVYTREELHIRMRVRVRFATGYFQAVDAVFMDRLINRIVA